MKKTKTIKGYKVTNPNYTCQGFKYEVGKTYTIEGDPSLCSRGFHFCQRPERCFDYYSFNSNNHVFEISASGKIIGNPDDKSVTNKITIIREIKWQDVLLIVNMGKDNTGDRNSGDWNSGNSNSGNRNSGDWNSGNRNSGDWNSGNSNSGDWNSGDWNSGKRNSGNRNSGYWNSGHRSNGIFNTEEGKISIFDIQIKMTLSEFENSKYFNALFSKNLTLNIWIDFERMTVDEVKADPNAEKRGGYLKTIPYKEACKIWWGELTNENKAIIKSMPHFNAKKFEQITGVNPND